MRCGGRDAQQGGDMCMFIADSLCCTAETKTALESSYTLIKSKSSNKFFLKSGREGQKNGLERFKCEKELTCQHCFEDRACDKACKWLQEVQMTLS